MHTNQAGWWRARGEGTEKGRVKTEAALTCLTLILSSDLIDAPYGYRPIGVKSLFMIEITSSLGMECVDINSDFPNE